MLPWYLDGGFRHYQHQFASRLVLGRNRGKKGFIVWETKELTLDQTVQEIMDHKVGHFTHAKVRRNAQSSWFVLAMSPRDEFVDFVTPAGELVGTVVQTTPIDYHEEGN